jgi:hypothetical protein
MRAQSGEQKITRVANGRVGLRLLFTRCCQWPCLSSTSVHMLLPMAVFVFDFCSHVVANGRVRLRPPHLTKAPMGKDLSEAKLHRNNAIRTKGPRLAVAPPPLSLATEVAGDRGHARNVRRKSQRSKPWASTRNKTQTYRRVRGAIRECPDKFSVAVSPSIAQKEDTSRKECYTRFAVGGVGPDFLRVMAMGVHPEESRGRRLIRRGVCRKVKFYYPLPGSPSGRPLIEAPNRAVLANSWNGYEGYLII